MRRSKFAKEREEAIKLRKKGLSIPYIESTLGINRSTLSGWFKNIELTNKQKDLLHQQWKNGLVKAREKAVAWHNQQKEIRLKKAEEGASEVIRNINLTDQNILELALAMLYLGEGFKSVDDTGIGNSDPNVLRIFLYILKIVYKVPENKIRCQLHLRMDQDEKEITKYWSKELNLPISCFKFTQYDKRTKGSPTYPLYKGVCSVRCSTVAIKRKLLNISRIFGESLLRA